MLTCIPDVIDADKLRQVHDMIAECEFVEGKRYASGHNAEVKDNLQVDRRSEGRKTLNDFLFDCLVGHERLMQVAMPNGIGPPLVSRYGPGMRYGLHTDGAFKGPLSQRFRADISVTIFLSDPASYDGGELVIQNPFGTQKVKLPAGAAVLYPSSTLHEVAEVTRGERVAAVFWMQSRVRDPAHREMIDQMRKVQAAMNALDPEAYETRLAEHLMHNLTRMWADL
jgi:PKHD-type hydroxylase